jgi:hypothetical protein
MLLAEGEFLQVTNNTEEFLKLRGRNHVPVISEMGNILSLNKQKRRMMRHGGVFYCAACKENFEILRNSLQVTWA